MTKPATSSSSGPSRRTVLKAGAIGVAGLGSGGFTWGWQSSTLRPGDRILVNQEGYGAGWPKQATVDFGSTLRPSRIAISIHEAETHRLVGQFNPALARTGALDFSDSSAHGRVYLQSGQIRSQPFEITEKPYASVEAQLLHAFRLQRCGQPLDDAITGLRHDACHARDATHAHSDEFASEGMRRDLSGGWHDAGDYGKYVATTALAIGEILSLDLRSRGQETATLDEMRIGLEWLLSMQRTDGALYRKVAPKKWPAMSIAPDADIDPRFVYGISSPDTAKAAAVFALAARAYDHDEFFAERCRRASDLAWAYLESHPEPHIDRTDGDDDGSGSYVSFDDVGQPVDWHDRLWAVTERYLMTLRSADHDHFLQHVEGTGFDLISWANPSAIGLLNYLASPSKPFADNAKKALRRSLLDFAKKLYHHTRDNPYGLAHSDFVWGSNRRTASAGLLLCQAFELTGHRAFLEAALAQANFLLGQNPFDMSFVTGAGTKSVQNIHHRFASVAGKPIPGLLVGGPNREAQAGIAPPDRGILSYVDDARSYATNEFAIEYNGALIHLLGRLESMDLEAKEDWLSAIWRRLRG